MCCLAGWRQELVGDQSRCAVVLMRAGVLSGGAGGASWPFSRRKLGRGQVPTVWSLRQLPRRCSCLAKKGLTSPHGRDVPLCSPPFHGVRASSWVALGPLSLTWLLPCCVRWSTHPGSPSSGL